MMNGQWIEEAGHRRKTRINSRNSRLRSCTAPNAGGLFRFESDFSLVLPEGDKYEYRCAVCGNTVGDKMDKTGQYFGVLKR